MYKEELKDILRSIRVSTVLSEGELYSIFCTSETPDERSKVLSALYTLENKGLIKCVRNGEMRHFMMCVPESKVQ